MSICGTPWEQWLDEQGFDLLREAAVCCSAPLDHASSPGSGTAGPQGRCPPPLRVHRQSHLAEDVSESLAESAAAYTKATARKCLLEKVEVVTGEEAESNVLQVGRRQPPPVPAATPSPPPSLRPKDPEAQGPELCGAGVLELCPLSNPGWLFCFGF